MPTPEERAAQKAKLMADMARARAEMEEMERAEEEERKRAEEEEKQRVEEEKRRREEEERRMREREAEEKRQREAEEKRQRDLAEFKRKEAESIARRSEAVKVAREAKAAKKVTPEEERRQQTAAMLERMEGGKGKKRVRSEAEDGVGETIVGKILVREGVTWVAKEGKECEPIARRGTRGASGEMADRTPAGVQRPVSLATKARKTVGFRDDRRWRRWDPEEEDEGVPRERERRRRRWNWRQVGRRLPVGRSRRRWTSGKGFWWRSKE